MFNFRLGPARLYQFRAECVDSKPGWTGSYNGTLELEYESPLLSPWLQTEISLNTDWTPETEVSVSDSCAYSGRVWTITVDKAFGFV